MDKNFFYLYVLFSEKDHKLYIGFTSNLQRRLSEHFSGQSKSTASRRPLQLIYSECYVCQEDARRRERYFKTSPGKKSLRLMLRETYKELNYQFQNK